MTKLYYKYITNGIPQEDLPYFGNNMEVRTMVIKRYYHNLFFKGRLIFVACVILPILLQLYFRNSITQIIAIIGQVMAIEYFRKGIVICKSFLTHSK